MRKYATVVCLQKRYAYEEIVLFVACSPVVGLLDVRRGGSSGPGDSPRQLSVSAVEEPGPDPGSLEIMQRAVDSVAAHSGQRSRSASVSGAQIEPTHRYVRFSPATKAQFDALFDQDEFTCYNFPLDEVSPVSADEGFRMSGPSDTPEQLYAVLRTTVVLPDTIASEV